ncbi:endonuclease/exonuclease/phosphatase family protein [Mariniblastus fucicola]|uniref:Endonuclease/exonuclease/phosphatase domain-containing protein n=1 Tax=Mariniblastus fucicola TaxID=980251 RepID=A0A5B9PBD7_9BACT|nr:endonuclease/exonuclease/phosphatase family protein [Mariniblastus fucicola]QEG20433.1 hypothetical protein MFFC18_02810 [Mariniblastus fucicola]
MKDPIRVTTATKLLKSVRRFFARSEWVVWLLGLQRTDAGSAEPGLILIQIDGLSQPELEQAIERGRMPFVKSLLDRENYVTHTMYSGLPSSTPAVQAELHYGIETVVPAFGFRDHRNGQLVRMFANDIARDIEETMQKQTTGLLAGGASYANIYSGGAEESHFCATSFGWNEFLNTVNPLKILLVMLLNFWMFVRVAALMVVEFFLASYDFVAGLFSGKQFWQELIMIPARVVVVVLLRELVTIGTCYDASRGLPVIHLNMLGYDEQAHRRGPHSAFARWTLKGIDRAIKRIWNTAHLGAGREYDVWVFSDHGQEETEPYELLHGKRIQQVVAETVESMFSDQPIPDSPIERPEEHSKHKDRLPSRANWVGLNWLVSMLFGEQDHDIQTRSPHVQTVTSGPIGFVYLLSESPKRNRGEIAEKLVAEHGVPMCTFLSDDDRAIAISAKGRFDIASESNNLFNHHPFEVDVAEDLIQLTRHVDSGEIQLIGWDGQQKTKSFVLQNGAHAGPGSEETHAFALLPTDTLLPVQNRDYLRPNDLRLAGLRFLGRDEHGDQLSRRARDHGREIRVLSYNVHACVGMDGLLSPSRIARVIEQSEADIICLQELDVFRSRSGNQDQAHKIAELLEMSHHFHPAWNIEEEQFGNAILTRLPMRVVQKQSLHHHKKDRSRRSAIWVEVELPGGTSLQIINTHLSIYPKEQRIQAMQLLDEWVEPAKLAGPVVLCGDLNARVASTTHRILCVNLKDIESFDANRTQRTLFSPFPISRVDHGFVSDQLRCSQVKVDRSRLGRVASDHLPLAFDLHLTKEADDR